MFNNFFYYFFLLPYSSYVPYSNYYIISIFLTPHPFLFFLCMPCSHSPTPTHSHLLVFIPSSCLSSIHPLHTINFSTPYPLVIFWVLFYLSSIHLLTLRFLSNYFWNFPSCNVKSLSYKFSVLYIFQFTFHFSSYCLLLFHTFQFHQTTRFFIYVISESVNLQHTKIPI